MDIQRPIQSNPTDNTVEISVHILSENIDFVIHPPPTHTHTSIQSRWSNFNQCRVRVRAVPSLWSRGVSSLLTEPQQVSHLDFVTSGLTQHPTG